MDEGSNLLHYPNMKPIPVYALYGEEKGGFGQDWLHWETIQSRARLHRYQIAPHRHEQFFQLLFVTAGGGRALLDGAEIDLAPPVAVVVPALTVHGYNFTTDVDGVVLTLMESDVTDLGLPFAVPMVIPGAAPIGEELRRLIAEADSPDAGHDLALRALVNLLLVALHRAGHDLMDAGQRTDRARNHVRRFRMQVDRRFRETRRIADYADAIGISATHLNRVCREVLGSSALMVIERRIALEARRQLRFSELSIKQIANDLGYDDPAYFSRFVTRALGVPPSLYRARSRQD
jgi:AraC family transcriptional regulator, transcriptional activator of pobA